jgi:hypothetical protein
MDIIKNNLVWNLGRFTRKLWLALLVIIIYLGFTAGPSIYTEGRASWAAGILPTSQEISNLFPSIPLPDEALKIFWNQLAEYSPAYALAFAFLFWGTISFPIDCIKSIFLLLVYGFLLSGAPLMKYMMKRLGESTILGHLGIAPPGWSIVFVFILLLFPINMFENNMRSKEKNLVLKNLILELQTSILAMKTTNSLSDESKTLNSSSTETPLKEKEKTENVFATEQNKKPKENVFATEQNKKPKENVPGAKNAQNSQPKKEKKAKEDSKSINWVAWVPIIIASIFGLGIVVGIFYYKCRKNKPVLRFEIDPNDVAAMQNYETRRNTRNEFGQKF